MEEFKLKDGRIVVAQEENIKGMAGEPMTILRFNFKDDSINVVHYNDLIKYMNPNDLTKINRWISDLCNCNIASAKSFCS